ncbi:MAG: ABC transporter ATP-binding protein/permease [Candidatus Sumerlaeaceae bacterium]|nr:ABC transporter ATP-binding protein/permease [Candidatus Sumerlaeaceae bacterium]
MTPDSYIEEDRVIQGADYRLAARLLVYVRPYWKLVLLSSVLSLVTAALQLAGPYIVKIAIDDHIMLGNADNVPELCGLYALTLALLFGFEYAQTYMIAHVGQRAMHDLRNGIFTHFQKLHIGYFDRNPVGRLMTRITSDVAALNELFSQGVMTVAGDIFLLAAIAGLMLATDWKLALLVMTTGPLLLLAGNIFRVNIRVAYRDVRARLSRMNTYLQENLSGMRTVQAYNREPRNFEEFSELNAAHRDANGMAIFCMSVFFPVVEMVAAIALALIVWYGGVQTLKGTLTLGTVYLFIQYAQRLFQPIKDLTEKFNVFQTAMASSERIFRLLDTPAEILPPATPEPFHGLQDEVTFENVWFAYKGEDWVLRDVSFKIRKGQTVALVGATGSGKTTITSLLARFYDVNRGTIRIDGIDIRNLSLNDLRRPMAVVLQDSFLFSGTMEGNIRLGNQEIDDERIRRAAGHVNALPFIDRLKGGMKHEVLERGATLSVGQKQLLSFARALAFDPQIMILDEATANIDTATELLIQDALEKLLRGRTSLVIAHRLSTIQNADLIIVLHHGRIRETGTHAELLQRDGLYRKLYELQFKHAAAPIAQGNRETVPSI